MTYATRHVYHVYAVLGAERDRLRQTLQQCGVQTGIHYPIPVSLQPAHQDLGYKSGDFPNAETAAATVLSLPMYAELNDAQIEYISKEVTSA